MCPLHVVHLVANTFSVFRYLHDSGDIVYITQGRLRDTVFLTPKWLCHNILGPLLTPVWFTAHTLRNKNGLVSKIDVRLSPFTMTVESPV